MNLKKILIIHPALAPYRIDFFNYLYSNFDVHIIFLRDNLYSFNFDQNSLRSQLKGSFEFRTQGLTIDASILYRKGIFNVIQKFRPDVVVTHEYSMISYQVAAYKLFKNNFKHLIWSADNVPMLKKNSFLNKKRKQILLKLSDGVSVYTEGVKSFMIKKFGINEDDIGVFPNIQNEKRLNSCETDAILSELSPRLKRLRNVPVILFVGRLANVKNIPYLIKAYKLAKEKGLKAKLVIIGDGAEFESIKKSIIHDPDILLEGPIQGEELKMYYKTADLFVLPSLHEPFGAVVNESLIYGTPVFCTVHAGAASLIKSGVNGELFDPYNSPKNLAEMLIDFFNKNKNKNKNNLMLSSFEVFASKWLPYNFLN